ncbi:DUF4402 domain-containing protein [Gammaproteobacteria bacterium]|nr:DUF4402 domain-containing protein [Gammaproteobacteria bacterium]
MKYFNHFVIAGLAAVAGSPSFAADVEADAGAKIVAPLQISSASALYFGTIAPSLTSADTVVVTPAGAKSCGEELTCLTEDHTAASFNVTGEPDASYTIEIPDSVNISNGAGGLMEISDFSGSKSSGTLISGADNFNVGGTLAVAANQASGEYTGTFTVAVEYQ